MIETFNATGTHTQTSVDGSTTTPWQDIATIDVEGGTGVARLYFSGIGTTFPTSTSINTDIRISAGGETIFLFRYASRTLNLDFLEGVWWIVGQVDETDEWKLQARYENTTATSRTIGNSGATASGLLQIL